MSDKKVFALNLGSSSTKVAYAENGKIIYRETIYHVGEEFAACTGFYEQEPLRLAAVEKNMKDHGVDCKSLDAIIARGGMLQPLPVGVFRINEALVEQSYSGIYGKHPSSMGAKIALDLANAYDAIPLTADVPSSDELLPVARYTGLKEVQRRTMTQTLNARAVLREWAAKQGKTYEDINAITVGLGGGMNTIAHCHGRMIDTNNSVDGEGCFSTNRCLTVPIDKLISECYSGKYTYEEMCWHVNGSAGLLGYLGTIDMQEILRRIQDGDKYADEVVEAMCYQIAKDIGAFATTLCGDVDVIILAGGMAYSPKITDRIIKRVKFIAPVVVRPGELEMEALCENAFWALDGQVPIHEFIPAKDEFEAAARINEIWAKSDWTFERRKK